MDDSAADSNRRAIRLALIVTALSFLLGLVLPLHSMDDAFITYRCARNLAQGHGLVFNPGQPVEAFSNFLYAVLLGAAFFLQPSLDPTHAARLLNHAGFLLILFLLFREAGRIAKPVERPWRELGAWWVGLHPAMLFYAHSGMETIFFTALLTAGFFLMLAVVEQGRSPIPAGLLFGLAADTRLEAAAFAGLAALLIFALSPRKDRRRRAISFTGAFVLVFVPVFAGRWLYYGYPFPNTYYAKVDGGGYELALRGLQYGGVWLPQNPLALFGLAASPWLLAANPRWRNRAVLGLSFVLGYLAYCTYVGGDYFPYSRFLIPVLPIVGWLFGYQMVFLVGWWRQRRPQARFIAQPFLFGFLAICLLWTLFYPRQLHQYIQQMRWSTAWAAQGRAMKEVVPPNLSLYLMTAGAIPYYSELVAYDSLGLVDPVLAHQDFELGRRISGHEKMDTRRIDALMPDLIYLGGYGAKANLEDELVTASQLHHRQGSLQPLLFSPHFAKFYRPYILNASADRLLFLVHLTAIPLVREYFQPLDSEISP